MMDDTDAVEKHETLSCGTSEDVHLRFTGTAKGRTFLVNVQFDRHDARTGSAMQPIEFGFMVTKIISLILKRIGSSPEPSLH